ncbi:MAG: hypothetical protein R6V85_07255 [Polyangia bacterium]
MLRTKKCIVVVIAIAGWVCCSPEGEENGSEASDEQYGQDIEGPEVNGDYDRPRIYFERRIKKEELSNTSVEILLNDNSSKGACSSSFRAVECIIDRGYACLLEETDGSTSFYILLLGDAKMDKYNEEGWDISWFMEYSRPWDEGTSVSNDMTWFFEKKYWHESKTMAEFHSFSITGPSIKMRRENESHENGGIERKVVYPLPDPHNIHNNDPHNVNMEGKLVLHKGTVIEQGGISIFAESSFRGLDHAGNDVHVTMKMCVE